MQTTLEFEQNESLFLKKNAWVSFKRMKSDKNTFFYENTVDFLQYKYEYVSLTFCLLQAIVSDFFAHSLVQ